MRLFATASVIQLLILQAWAKGKMADPDSASARIAGGSEVNTTTNYPMVACLTDNSNTVVCGATLIGNSYIVTAAQCVNDPDQKTHRVYVGNVNSIANKGQGFEMDEIKIHGLYNSQSKDNDIAVVKLSGSVTIGADVAPACLQNKLNTVMEFDVVTALGWGAVSRTDQSNLPSKLMKADLGYLAPETCQDTNYRGYKNPLPCGTICTNPKQAGGVCNGDQGGPLLHQQSGGAPFLIGITSQPTCDSRTEPSVFTNIAYHLDFIKEAMLPEVPCVIQL